MVGSQVGPKSYRGSTRTLKSLTLSNPAPLQGRLIRRYKRFLADVEWPDGEVTTVHCPNPGSMKGTDRPGSAVRCSTSPNPNRKLPLTLEMIRVGRIWVGLHAARANTLIAQALAQEALPFVQGYGRVRSEVRVGDRSRLDFALDQNPKDPRPLYIEVKSVTLAEGVIARFPDAVTERGRRHLEELTALHSTGARSMLLFVVQRGDCNAVEPADDIDPAYGAALRQAAKAGVETRAVRARVSARGLRLEKELPVRMP